MKESSVLKKYGMVLVAVIILAITVAAVMLLLSKRQPPVSERLQKIAQELPPFEGNSIAEGEKADGTCGEINKTDSNLPAITYEQEIPEGTFNEKASTYQEAVTKTHSDITWSPLSLQSRPFVRDNKRYAITILEYTIPENTIGISLTACDY